MLGNGNGTFGALMPYPAFPFRGVNTVAVADLNGDGKLDIAAGIDIFTGPNTADNYEMAILLGDGKGHFTKSSEWPVYYFPAQIVAAKMRPGGPVDLVVRNFGGFTIFPNDGHGNFPHNPYSDYNPGSFEIVVGDFNGDGINDVASNGHDQLSVLLGKGDGTLEGGPYGPYVHSFNAMVGPIAAGNINQDGALDIVTASPLGVSRFINAAIPAP